MEIKESLNVTFDKTPPPSKTSLLVDDDLDEEEVIKVTEKKNLENGIKDETLEIDEIVNIKESRNHPLENIIGNLNQRTLRSQPQNQSNFFCFISTIEPKNMNEALNDESKSSLIFNNIKCSTIPGQMANLLAYVALSARSIVVTFALLPLLSLSYFLLLLAFLATLFSCCLVWFGIHSVYKTVIDLASHSRSWLSSSSSSRALPNLNPRYGSSSGIVCGGWISVGRRDGGGSGDGAQAQERTLVHDPLAPWDQVHTLKDVVPAPTTVGAPPRKDPQKGYSKIVP
ncbi:hypothetical protein Tco_0812333 [Tanacetum coccineum]